MFTIKLNLKQLSSRKNTGSLYMEPVVTLDLESEEYKVHLRRSSFDKELDVNLIEEELMIKLSETIAKKFEKSISMQVNKPLDDTHTEFTLQANVVLPNEMVAFEAKEEILTRIVKAAYGELGATKDELSRTKEELNKLTDKTLWQKLVWSIKNY